MKIRTLVLCTALALSQTFTPAAASNLLDIYQQALENDPGLKAAEAQRLATREAIPQSKAVLLPALSASGETNRIHYSPDDSARPSDTYSSSGYSLNLSQVIYNRALQVQRRQANKQALQADATYESAVQTLVLDVATRYFSVLAAIDNLETARAEKAAIARQLEQTKQRFDVGLIAITDVHEAQARYDLTVASEITAQNQLDTAREALRELTNTLPEELSSLGKELPLISPEPESLDAWVGAAEQNNLQLTAARYGVEVARQEVKRQSAGHYPSLNLVGSYGTTNTGSIYTTIDQADSASIGLQLSVPLYQGGLVTSRTRQAEYSYLQASETLEQSRRSIQRQTRDAYRGVIAGISQVKALEQALISNQSALEATQAGFEVGTRTIVDVLDAQRALYAAQRDYSQSRYNYIVATLNLKQAAGSLTVEDLKQVNEWLQAQTQTGQE